MTVFSTLKLSSLTLFTLIITWMQPSVGQSVSISRIYDENKGQGVKVYVRARILDENNEPEKTINSNSLIVKSDENNLENFTIEQAKDNQLDPSRFIILLDMSNSMTALDANGEIRGIAAINAIRSFAASLENYPSKISIVPFAQAGKGCGLNFGYLPPPVNNQVLNNFLLPNSNELENKLLELEAKFPGENEKDKHKNRPCGSTNFRDPLPKAIQYLKREFPAPENLNETKTRLGIILISDGYDPVLSHANKYNKPEIIQLENLLKSNASSITVYTLGYGIENSSREEDRVDKKVLERLAKAGKGTFKFSGNETEIIESLGSFLSSLYGDYEIIYTPTNTQPGSRQTVEIKYVNASDKASFRLDNIPTLPLTTRMVILGSAVIAFGFLGVLPFMGWRWYLENYR